MDLTGVGAVAELAGKVVDKIWPDKSEAERHQLAMALTIIQGQMDTNKIEAGNTDRFVSGWRPAIGWVCGLACAWNWVGISVCQFALQLAGKQVALAPADLTEMLPVLIGMLGLGFYRSMEKIKGVA